MLGIETIIPHDGDAVTNHIYTYKYNIILTYTMDSTGQKNSYHIEIYACGV